MIYTCLKLLFPQIKRFTLIGCIFICHISFLIHYCNGRLLNYPQQQTQLQREWQRYYFSLPLPLFRLNWGVFFLYEHREFKIKCRIKKKNQRHLAEVNPWSKTKELNTDNNRENGVICIRSSADQNWQRSSGSHNEHKASNDGNRQIGKSNRVPCHRPSLPPSVSQQMLCSAKTLSAAKEWPEISWQWPWGLGGQQGRGKERDENRRNKQKKHCRHQRPSSQWWHSTREEVSARVCVQTSLQELELSLWKHSQTPPWDYFYSIHMHAHTCQLQARRRPGPDGGELHNSRICLWPLKVCLKGLSNSQWTSPKNTERRRHAIWSHSLWANPFPGRSQNSHITISLTPNSPPRDLSSHSKRVAGERISISGKISFVKCN